MLFNANCVLICIDSKQCNGFICCFKILLWSIVENQFIARHDKLFNTQIKTVNGQNSLMWHNLRTVICNKVWHQVDFHSTPFNVGVNNILHDRKRASQQLKCLPSNDSIQSNWMYFRHWKVNSSTGGAHLFETTLSISVKSNLKMN